VLELEFYAMIQQSVLYLCNLETFILVIYANVVTFLVVMA